MTLPRPLRIALIAVVAIIVIAAGGRGRSSIGQFDPNSLKPRIIEAVKRATGRDLALNGKIGLKFSLTPTIRVDDVAFANPPDFSRPADGHAPVHGTGTRPAAPAVPPDRDRPAWC